MPPGFNSNGKYGLSKLLKVGVLAGGDSSERNISLRSGRAVHRALQSLGFQTAFIDPKRRRNLSNRLQSVDVAFIALHGHGGEDGTIQKQLERSAVPYVGSGPRGCREAFDKVTAKRIFARHGIPTPEWTLADAKNWKRRLPHFPRPFFVKPVRDGSSIGVFCVEEINKSAEKIKATIHEYRKVLIERKIEGREFTVGILGKRALPVIELRPKRSFYDFKAKYTKGMTEYLVRSSLPRGLTGRLQSLALRVHRALGLRDLSRVDIMVDRKDRPYVLEANSIPGFTELSLLPKAASAAGIPFYDLCYDLIQQAYHRRRGKRVRYGKKKTKKTRS